MSAIGFFSIIGLHYIPWEKLLGKELQPPTTYICGVAVIGATFSVWCAWARPSWAWAIAGFWIVTAATGAGDVIAYLLDELGGGRMERRTRGRPSSGSDARD
jgi:hypothetical protein